MNDQQVWEQAVAAISRMYRDLEPEKKAELGKLIDIVMQLKQELVERVTAAGSSVLCQTCGGDCCLYGKYHLSALDVLAFLATDAGPVVPDFTAGPHCPYSDAKGCLMVPRYRPMTCVIFNCEQIENRLTPSDRDALRACEQKLRDAILRAGNIRDTRLDRPVLLFTEPVAAP